MDDNSLNDVVVNIDNLDEFSRMVGAYKAENDRREEQDKKRLKTDKIFLSIYIMGGLYYLVLACIVWFTA